MMTNWSLGFVLCAMHSLFQSIEIKNIATLENAIHKRLINGKKLLKNKETAKTQRLDCFLKCIFYKQQGSVFSKHAALLLHAPYRDGKAADIEIGFCVILCWWRRGESNSCPKTAPRNFLRAQSGVFYSRRRRRRTPRSSRYPFNL